MFVGPIHEFFTVTMIFMDMDMIVCSSLVYELYRLLAILANFIYAVFRSSQQHDDYYTNIINQR